MQELERRDFLGKAGKVAIGLGALWAAATIPGCGRRPGEQAPPAENAPATTEQIPAPPSS